MHNSAKNLSRDSLGLLHISTLNLFAAYIPPSTFTCSTLPYAPAPICLLVDSAVLTFNSGSSSHLWAVDEIDYGHINIGVTGPYLEKLNFQVPVAMVMTILSHHADRLYYL